ncbi:hypothetical protein AQ856_05980 [Burkholderia pseudomallei]|nr:hypothetical protein AQ760_00510 [Burkholderia pseudomallei]OMY89087.1 hypothetical protein AQ854_00250 [Burkholderia pseudomallei]OMY98668.1 hypothetical protein AQ856_05980 [Burkholderia pseudomallei]OMZ23311.1 hypothetical protein AQ859_29685 [Burkholderia pseudomallei]OMZ27633.1 hypothetical protein AQ861_24760 [Burkholderia pseudomallei]
MDVASDVTSDAASDAAPVRAAHDRRRRPRAVSAPSPRRSAAFAFAYQNVRAPMCSIWASV